jgi:hypothetical protein
VKVAPRVVPSVPLKQDRSNIWPAGTDKEYTVPIAPVTPLSLATNEKSSYENSIASNRLLLARQAELENKIRHTEDISSFDQEDLKSPIA